MEISSKTTIRKRFLDLLRTQKEEERLRKSREIQEKVFSFLEFQNAKTVLFYASFDGEVETFQMMKQAKQKGKKIALPKIVEKEKQIIPILVEDIEDDLQEGPYGIKQPKKEKGQALGIDDIDLAIVPGVVFDRENNRLGRGLGYYDRFLGSLPSRIPTFGLAFDFQLVDSLSHQKEHDVPVSRVIIN